MNGPIELPNLFESIPPEHVGEALKLAIEDIEKTHTAAVSQLVAMAEKATGEQMRQTATRTVLDHTVSDLVTILQRADHLRVAVDKLKQWVPATDLATAKIGHRLKTMPPEVADAITSELKAAGLV
ncbi:hypothetical protein [Streptomyces sp. NPDC051665]|uniref:hypothetical protein n=1 Tax=Streptomyces sp. NPDC051665 TaxID=3154647 RepID=UPI003433C89D